MAVLAAAALAGASLAAAGQAGNGEASAQLAAQVKPILARCAACHAGANPMGGLNLTRRDLALKGGKSGPALKPGSAAESAAYRMVAAKKMPPDALLKDM